MILNTTKPVDTQDGRWAFNEAMMITGLLIALLYFHFSFIQFDNSVKYVKCTCIIEYVMYYLGACFVILPTLETRRHNSSSMPSIVRNLVWSGLPFGFLPWGSHNASQP